jgi:hypothetical protein
VQPDSQDCLQVFSRLRIVRGLRTTGVKQEETCLTT